MVKEKIHGIESLMQKKIDDVMAHHHFGAPAPTGPIGFNFFI
jgi:hypothetical protein